MAPSQIFTEVPSLQLIEATAVLGEYRSCSSDRLGREHSITIAVDRARKGPLVEGQGGR